MATASAVPRARRRALSAKLGPSGCPDNPRLGCGTLVLTGTSARRPRRNGGFAPRRHREHKALARMGKGATTRRAYYDPAMPFREETKCFSASRPEPLVTESDTAPEDAPGVTGVLHEPAPFRTAGGSCDAHRGSLEAVSAWGTCFALRFHGGRSPNHAFRMSPEFPHAL